MVEKMIEKLVENVMINQMTILFLHLILIKLNIYSHWIHLQKNLAECKDDMKRFYSIKTLM